MTDNSDIVLYTHQVLIITIRLLADAFKLSKEHITTILFGAVVGLLLRDNSPDVVRRRDNYYSYYSYYTWLFLSVIG